VKRLVIRLFGAPRIAFDGVPWRVAIPPRCMQLLAYLALRPGASARAAVAAALWPDELDSAARSNLRRHLHLLRRALPEIAGLDWLHDTGGSIGWNDAAPASIDLAAFLSQIDDPQTRRAALDLVDGDLLAGYDDEWLVIERERLRSRYLEGLLDETVSLRRDRDFSGAVLYAERLLAADDLREDAVREIITARYEGGDRGSALATYERFAARLTATLGVAPAPETQALAAALRAGTPLFVDEVPEPAARTGWLPTFAGRDAELATLRIAWSRAARGMGATIFVGGEAGIGKSRLVTEFADTVRNGGGRVVVATTSDPEAEPYQPVFGALRRLLPFAAGLDDDRRYAGLARALPELGTLAGATGDGTGARSESIAREQLFDGVTAFVAHVARTKPLLIALEDLHWAGEATIEALGAIARCVGALPALVIVTYRSDETAAAHPLRELRAKLAAERRATSLSLRRLDAASVTRMLAASEVRDLPIGVAATIARVSDGNPLFAAQLARTYVETGALPVAATTGAIGATIASRIARIDADVRAIGETAAAIGETFGVDLVSAAGGWDEADVIDAFGTLMDAAMIREAGAAGHTYRFSHALIADAMYAAMPDATRSARHRRLAQLIERTAVHDRATLEAVARHWRGAGDNARASQTYLRNAIAALDVFARADAVAYARTAADLALDDAARFQALRIAATAPARSGEREGWEADLDRLAAVAERLGDDERFEAHALREAYSWQSGRPADSAVAIAAMAAIAERTGNSVQTATALERRSRADVSAGRMHDALANARAALTIALADADSVTINRLRAFASSIALRVGDLEASSALLNAQREALAGAGTLVERMDIARAESMIAIARQDGALAERCGRELLELARAAGDREYQGTAFSLLAYAAHERYDARAVREHYANAEPIYRQLGRAQMVVMTALNHGIFEADIGNHARALAAFDDIMPQAEALSMRPTIGYMLVHRSTIALIDGETAAALTSARAACGLGTATGERRVYAEGLIALGAALTVSCDPAAIETLREAITELRACGAERILTELLPFLIDALLGAGRAAEAHEYAAGLWQQFFADNDLRERYPARIALALAREAVARGDVAAADAARERGRTLVRERIAMLADDGAAYAALPFNRELLHGAGILR
jgi:DNA-binding SARP family transcriptional activator